MLTIGKRMVAFSEPNDTFGLHYHWFLQHRKLKPLEVLLITAMVLGDDINYSIFKYARKRVNSSVCHQNIKILCLQVMSVPLGYAFIKCHLLILKYNCKKCKKHFHGTKFQEKAKSLCKLCG